MTAGAGFRKKLMEQPAGADSLPSIDSEPPALMNERPPASFIVLMEPAPIHSRSASRRRNRAGAGVVHAAGTALEQSRRGRRSRSRNSPGTKPARTSFMQPEQTWNKAGADGTGRGTGTDPPAVRQYRRRDSLEQPRCRFRKKLMEPPAGASKFKSEK